MKLKAKQMCPLHRRRDCCGRSEFNRYRQPTHEKKGIWTRVVDGVMRAPDGREKCSPRELRRRKAWFIRNQPTCVACNRGFSVYDEIELAHKSGKGIGSGKRDDSWANLAGLMHADENREQGSRPLETYLADPNRIALRKKENK